MTRAASSRRNRPNPLSSEEADPSSQPSADAWWREDFGDRYAGLIFDCDGTLTDSMPLHYIAWRDTMATYGVTFVEEKFYAMGGMPSEKIIAILSDEQQRVVDAAEASEAKEQAFVDQMHLLKARHDVVHLAKAHRNRVAMSVASGGIRPIVQQQLAVIGVGDWFPVVVTSEDTVRHKPEPDVFLLAAERMGVAADRCLVLEDSPLGLEAARRASMDCIDVRDGSLHRAGLG